MTYAAGGLIQASDFNNLVGPYSTPNLGSTINAIWGIGSGNKGYGQTQISNVGINDTVTFDDWSTLIKTMNTIAYRQASTVTNYTPPAEGNTIQYLSNLVSNKNTLYANANYARQQVSPIPAPVSTTNLNSWLKSATFTQTITFQSADKARYFFNAGGQIAITLSHPGGTNANLMWNTLATAAGTIVLSAPLPNTSSVIAGTTYTGVTKIGGSGSSTVNTNVSYYTLDQNYVQVFNQKAFAVTSNYLESYVSVKIKTNGTQGINGDRGSVITVQTLWDEIPNGLLVSYGTTVNITVKYPFSQPTVTSNYQVPFVNTWGTVSVSGSVTSE